MNNAIEIRSLCKKYSDFALQNVSFNVPSGSIVGFIGENGAGKTTTLKSLLNIIFKDSGDIKVLGLDPQKDIKEINSKVGVVMADSFFYDSLRADYVPKILSGLYQTWDKNYYNELMHTFKLPQNKLIKEYSKGMKMKLNIATALAHRPQLLILDEATSGLDPVVRSEILDVFQDFVCDDSHSILMSSHITTDLEKIADYITFIHNGKIVFSEQKDELLEKYAVAKCTQQQAALLPKELIAGQRHTKFDVEVLVTDRQKAKMSVSDIILDKASIDDIMTFIAKEE